MSKSLYLHPLDVTLSGVRAIEILSAFAIIEAAGVSPLGVIKSAHPFAVAPGGVVGLPYLPSLAPAGTIISASSSLTTLLLVTDSNLRPDWRDATPTPTVESIQPFQNNGSFPAQLEGGVNLTDGSFYPLAHMGTVIPQPIVIGDTLAKVLAKGFFQY